MPVTKRIREKVLEALEELSEEKLKVALDFIEHLREKEERDATLEILSNRELMDQIKETELALKEGKMEEFIPWDEARRDE